MEQLKEIYDSLDSTNKQQFHNACSPDNYINVEVIDGHTIISHSKTKGNNSVMVKNPLAVLHASNIIFHTPDKRSVQSIKDIIHYVDLQCTDPSTTDVEIEAGERLLNELNDMSDDDSKTLAIYIERIENTVTELTQFVTNNKPVYDYITTIIDNDNAEEDEKTSYEHVDIYDALIAEKTENELMILFHEINVNISKHMILIFKLNTLHEELVERIKSPLQITNIQTQIDDFQMQMDNNEKLNYAQHIELIKTYNKMDKNNESYNNLFEIIVKIGNKMINDLQIEKLTVNEYENVFADIVTIKGEYFTIFTNFDTERKEILEKVKNVTICDENDTKQISKLVENMKIALKLFKQYDEFIKVLIEKIEKLSQDK